MCPYHDSFNKTCFLLSQIVFQQLWCIVISGKKKILSTTPSFMFNITKGYSIFEVSIELPIFLISHSVILVYCIFLVGLFLTSTCLVGSFALGQRFDELLNGHDAIQTDVIENNQPTGPLYVSNMFVKGKILIWKCSNSWLQYVVIGWRMYHCWSSSEFYLDTLLSEKIRNSFEVT